MLKFFKIFSTKKAVGGRFDGKAGGLSAKTIKNIKNMMNSAFQQAIANELINKNYLKSVKLERVINKEMRVLNIVEQSKLIKACRQSQNLASFGIIMCLFTGIRIGELLALTWDNIDLDNNKLYIKQSIKRVRILEDNPETKTELKILHTKTSCSTRTIDLLDSLAKDILIFKKKHTLLHGENNKVVIANGIGGFFEPRNYTDLFYKLVEESEISDSNFHATRHTFATRAIEQGMDILVLSKILGHAQPSTTLNKYGHVLEEHKKTSMEKMKSLYV